MCADFLQLRRARTRLQYSSATPLRCHPRCRACVLSCAFFVANNHHNKNRFSQQLQSDWHGELCNSAFLHAASHDKDYSAEATVVPEGPTYTLDLDGFTTVRGAHYSCAACVCVCVRACVNVWSWECGWCFAFLFERTQNFLRL